MKIVFRIVGILTGILLMFFFLQYSNYAIFPMRIGTVLDCSVKKGITSNELVNISQKNNITTFTISYDNTSFFSRKINFKYLNVNPNDHICFGLQKNLLPTTQVYYTEQGSEVTYIQRFWAVENEGADFKAFVDELEDNSPEYEQFNPVKLSILDILNVQNLYFFMCVFLLLLFCNFVWLHMRCEELTVSVLHNGKAFNKIKPQLIKNIWKTVTPYLLISGAFGAYVLLRNSSFIFDYLVTFFIFGLILFAIQIICMCLTFTIVRNVAISSLTGEEKRYFSIVLFLFCGIISACLFITSSQNTYFNIMNITILDKGIMPSEKVLDFPVDCNTLTGSVNL